MNNQNAQLALTLENWNNYALQHYVCVMCFTACLKECASYRAFCVFQDSLFMNDLPEVLSSGLEQTRHLGL